jgi:hypothetical protein
MLKKSASFVLASLRGSTLRSTPRVFGTLKGLFRSPRSIRRANGYTKCGPYLLASSLAAAALDSLSEHPASHSYNMTIRNITVSFEQKLSFPQPTNEKP